jgi:signal transduction histidine kinase
MSQEHSSTPPIQSPAAALDAATAKNPDAEPIDSAGRKVLEAGTLLAQFGSFGVIWMTPDLTVEETYGRLTSFVTKGAPVTDSILPIIGLEGEILALAREPHRVLELPAVSVATGAERTGKLNFTFIWNTQRNAPLAIAYKSASQTEIEVELSKQIRARLMAEAEVTAKSKELARANSDLESFAAIISHDLKAPLRHMRQLTETAFEKTEAGSDAALRDILRDIEGQSRRMSHMLTALLDYSTIGRKYEALETVDTGSLIAAVKDSLPESGHEIEIDGRWPVLRTLRAPLDLVLRNLVANALQHHDKATGHIAVRCEEQPQFLVFSIADDGPGIDPHHHESIFLPFRTLQNDAERPSTGMGLAAVKKIVEGAGGTIAVSSDPKTSRGTVFAVTWPKALLD